MFTMCQSNKGMTYCSDGWLIEVWNTHLANVAPEIKAFAIAGVVVVLALLGHVLAKRLFRDLLGGK